MRIAISLLITVVGLGLAGRRLWWVVRLIRSGQPAKGRFDDVATLVRTEVAEVPGQRKLLAWTVPGLAHFFTMWGFFVLTLTIIELFGSIFDEEFHFPVIGRWAVVGFVEDFFAVAVLIALATFAVIRVRNEPKTKLRASRFYGSHTGAAWIILLMISLVMLGLIVFRGVQTNIDGHFPYGDTWATFASKGVGMLFSGLSVGTLKTVELWLIWVQLVVLMGFLVLVAAWSANPTKAGGIDEAFRTLLQQPYGAVLVVLLGAGLMTFGVYGLAEAAWRRVTDGGAS